MNLNFSIDSIESGRDPKSSIRSISVVKDEDPSSVTSSGCSPPLLSHIDSPMNVRQLRDEEKKDSLRNSENDVKPEPSSTKQSNSVDLGRIVAGTIRKSWRRALKVRVIVL